MSVKNIVSQFVMVALCLLSLAIGTDGFNLTGLNSLIFWQSRFPRTLSIVLVGSSMSLAGLLMQSISNNKFAGPSTVGTIEAAKLGLILCLITPGITNGNKIFFSFLSAAVFTLGFITLLRQIHIKKDWMVPLFGIIYGQLLNGLGQAIAYRFQLTQNIQSWVQGSFAMIQVGRYEWLFLNIITIFISYLLIHRLSIVKLGEDFSTNLGINYQATWLIIIMCVSLTTAVNVMVVGTLPFIGVIIPNILRIQSGDLLAHSMSAVMIYGADSRFGLIYQVLGFQPIKDFVIEDQRHGQSVRFEGILDLNPDRIFVIDRTQAIGSGNSANADLVENALIKETKAYQNDQIHFLSSQLWYVSGSGLESTHLQIQEIANLMQP